jgi:predicted RNA-binding Zn-ribbon protein involved in translation (DUF1610 family)
MINEEAQRIIDGYIVVANYTNEDYVDCVNVEALRAASVALEKQVSKKPHVHPLYGQSFYNCPTCGAGKFAIMRGKKTRNDYCLKCGQALDWKEVGE